MKIPLHQVDAFASRVFRGNPAAVCHLPTWLDDTLLLSIAAENNLSETAFFVDNGDPIELRWFTPLAEVQLCGHGTLAAAYVILEQLHLRANTVTFSTKSGLLTVSRRDSELIMDFPAQSAGAEVAPANLADALGSAPREVLIGGGKLLAVYESEEAIRSLTPDFARIAAYHPLSVVVTARGRDADFVSRYFAPSFGVPEDPVTGAAHCLLAPYWARVLGKTRLRAQQLSRRGGEILCEVGHDRVLLSGRCAPFLIGEIEFDQ